MCRKFVLVSNIEQIANRFGLADPDSSMEIPASYGISVGDTTFIITMENPHELQSARFGMTPYWAKSRMDLINARAEGGKNLSNDPSYLGPLQIFLKKAFLKPIQSQRCCVLADAYFEWSMAKKPCLVYLQNKQRPFAMAGLYDHWKNPFTHEILTSFTIITIPANSLLQNLGVKRMPVILPTGYERDWLKADQSLTQVLRQLKPYPSQNMNAYPVADLVNTPGLNDPAMVNPIGERLQKEEELARKTTSSNQHGYKKKPDPGLYMDQRGK